MIQVEEMLKANFPRQKECDKFEVWIESLNICKEENKGMHNAVVPNFSYKMPNRNSLAFLGFIIFGNYLALSL
jgi:hypothetical protein